MPVKFAHLSTIKLFATGVFILIFRRVSQTLRRFFFTVSQTLGLFYLLFNNDAAVIIKMLLEFMRVRINPKYFILQ